MPRNCLSCHMVDAAPRAPSLCPSRRISLWCSIDPAHSFVWGQVCLASGGANLEEEKGLDFEIPWPLFDRRHHLVVGPQPGLHSQVVCSRKHGGGASGLGRMNAHLLSLLLALHPLSIWPQSGPVEMWVTACLLSIRTLMASLHIELMPKSLWWPVSPSPSHPPDFSDHISPHCYAWGMPGKLHHLLVPLLFPHLLIIPHKWWQTHSLTASGTLLKCHLLCKSPALSPFPHLYLTTALINS